MCRVIDSILVGEFFIIDKLLELIVGLDGLQEELLDKSLYQ